uniref:Uncharacterized protein n=1 Tax=Romanomermis culicivorax TaxID=13658 RepID=A0A915KB29_ROMCU
MQLTIHSVTSEKAGINGLLLPVTYVAYQCKHACTPLQRGSYSGWHRSLCKRIAHIVYSWCCSRTAEDGAGICPTQSVVGIRSQLILCDESNPMLPESMPV